jgi:hypothetical protein
MISTYSDLVESALYFVVGHVLVVQMALLRVVSWEEVLVILECANVVIRIRMEQVTEDFRVHKFQTSSDKGSVTSLSHSSPSCQELGQTSGG